MIAVKIVSIVKKMGSKMESKIEIEINDLSDSQFPDQYYLGQECKVVGFVAIKYKLETYSSTINGPYVIYSPFYDYRVIYPSNFFEDPKIREDQDDLSKRILKRFFKVMKKKQNRNMKIDYEIDKESESYKNNNPYVYYPPKDCQPMDVSNIKINLRTVVFFWDYRDLKKKESKNDR